MSIEWPNWLGNINEALSHPYAGAVNVLVAVACGGIIGAERESANKPAGLRTTILICLGAAIFTQASVLLAGASADRTRIAAQIVTGIGFLGAGAIVRERGMVFGVTTGAGIWATAAVGMLVGGGYVVPGFLISLLILGTLAAERLFGRLVNGPCDFTVARVTFEPRCGKTRLRMQSILDKYSVGEKPSFQESEDEGLMTIQYCRAHPSHRAFLAELATLKSVTNITYDERSSPHRR